jgi:uncharacterized repeat protein (TIGR01451 family)
LNAGVNYPPLTVTVNVAANAPSNVINTSSVAGGGETNFANNTVTDTTTIVQVADLTITKSHVGNFRQGQVGAMYSLIANNVGPGPTSGTVTITDMLPTGLTATAISGSGWTCILATLTCTRTDALPSGSSYPAITLTVDVAASASNSLTNSAVISGGGELDTSNDTATDVARVVAVADLIITKTHIGNFYQGEAGATYTITISNVGPGSTLGTVTVTDTLPAGLTATALSGAGWACDDVSVICTRTDVLPSNSNYPAITLTVSVAIGAASSLTNIGIVSGGGELNTANDTAMDVTTIALPPDFSISASPLTSTFLPGQHADYTITVADQNFPFPNAVSLSAVGLPPKSSLVFTPTSVSPGAASATSSLFIATTGDPFIGSIPGNQPLPPYNAFLSIVGMVFTSLALRSANSGRLRRVGLLLGIAGLFCGLGLYGCTGLPSNFQNLSTPPGTYTVTVTGSSGTVTHSITITLTVSP